LLLDIPLDEVMTGINDRHFLEEGRRTIAVTRFHVLDDEYGHRESADDDDDDDDGREEGQCQNYDWETELFRTCWSEIAHLTYQDVGDTGSLRQRRWRQGDSATSAVARRRRKLGGGTAAVAAAASAAVAAARSVVAVHSAMAAARMQQRGLSTTQSFNESSSCLVLIHGPDLNNTKI